MKLFGNITLRAHFLVRLLIVAKSVSISRMHKPFLGSDEVQQKLGSGQLSR